MARPTVAVVDLDAIRANLALARTRAPRSRLLAVLKSNAYGHGAVAVARAIEGHCDGIGVACLEEAAELREAGIRTPILLMEGCFEGAELHEAARLDLHAVVHCPEQVEMLAAARLDRPLHIWLKLDSGMHRLGLDPKEFPAACQRLRALPQVASLTLMSHLSRADEPESDFTRQQLELFRRLAAPLGLPLSLANSAAILCWPETHGDWVRSGLMSYGISPLPLSARAAQGLQPAMELRSALIAVRDLQPGDVIGYGCHYRCERPMRIGVVAMGYGDGFPRCAPNGLPVLVRGVRCPLAGRISMDMLTVDLTPVPDARPGDPVVLWGRELPLEEIAPACGTIPYELLTQLSPRVPRRYLAQEPGAGSRPDQR